MNVAPSSNLSLRDVRWITFLGALALILTLSTAWAEKAQTIAYKNGDTYVGDLNEGKQYGIGTYSFKDGTKYVGEWKDDQRHGRGIAIFIGYGQGSVVIYDVIYNVHKNTKVYLFNPEVDNTKLKNREEASLETLTPGMTLGYTVTSNGNSHPSRIKEIWILPKESVAAMDSEEGEKKN